MDIHSKTTLRARNLVIAADFLIMNAIIVAGWFIHYGTTRSWADAGGYYTLIVANVAMVVSQFFFSTIIHFRRPTLDMIFRQTTCLVALQRVVEFLLGEFILEEWEYVFSSFHVFAAYTCILYLAILFSRYFERWMVRHFRSLGLNSRDVLFVGSDEQMIPIYEYLIKDSTYGYHVLGYYADNTIARCPEGLTRLGSIADLNTIMATEAKEPIARDIYCCLPGDLEKIKSIIKYCNRMVAHFYYIPTVSQIFDTVRFRIENIGDTVVFTNHYEPLLKPVNKAIKRGFDILVSFFICLVLAIMTPFIALCIRLQSKGPIFFSQTRTGLNGQDFKCYKFRSMHVNDDADKVQATENDARKFPFGNLMRKMNIDELPQFFNVLKGDMSIVGPRPHMLAHTEMYRELIDTYMVRHFVKPGITGWAQVTGFRGETKELWQMQGRVRRDIWYIENWSFFLDLRIILKTAMQVFRPDKLAY